MQPGQRLERTRLGRHRPTRSLTEPIAASSAQHAREPDKTKARASQRPGSDPAPLDCVTFGLSHARARALAAPLADFYRADTRNAYYGPMMMVVMVVMMMVVMIPLIPPIGAIIVATPIIRG